LFSTGALHLTSNRSPRENRAFIKECGRLDRGISRPHIFPEKGQRRFTAASRLDLMTINGRHSPDGNADQRLVIHDQNALRYCA
jgi:hypothetical protein